MTRLLISTGLLLVAVGLALAGLGALLGLLGIRGGRWLAGDIVISRPGMTLVFPVVTSVLLSLVLSLLLWVVFAWRR